MRLFSALFLVSILLAGSEAQFFNRFFRGVGNFFRPVMHMIHSAAPPSFGPPRPFRGGGGPPRGRPELSDNGGTKKPQASGIDNPFPDDCGRDPKKGTGLLCFPDGKLCQERVNRVGNDNYNGHTYWFSWLSDDPSLKNEVWDWFNARNYCRKRCMDLVSIETEAEYEWLKAKMAGVKYIWTSGRLCNFDGCDRPDFQPKNINGWFWSANQARLSPTNSTHEFQDWSFTGGLESSQPDNREKLQGGEEEACLAVLNNFYGDGIKWHDVACTHEKPIVCEDTEGHIHYARQQFPNLSIP